MTQTSEPAYPAPLSPEPEEKSQGEAAGPALACANQVGLSGDLDIDYQEAPEAILDYLTQGATLVELDESLTTAGMGSIPRAVWASDMTGDGVDEVVVSIFDPESELVLPSGKLLIYQCEGGAASLVHQKESDPGAGVPHLWYLEDLDGDANSELVVSEATCGAHTCFEEVQILSWETGGYVNLLQGSAADLPTPDFRVVMSDESPKLDLEVASGGVLSVGAGPQRLQVRRWSLQPESGMYEVIEDGFLPSDFRIHILHDAEHAAAAGDAESALVLYDQAARDMGLLDWMDPETERAVIGAFAFFRIVQLHLLAGQEGLAEDVYGEMESLYPDSPYATMTGLFLAEYTEHGYGEACVIMQDFAAEHHKELLEPLGPVAFGYTNPEIEINVNCQ